MAFHNVHDYGARANGADDSAAIQRAIDAAAQEGGTVYLPAGTYALANSLYGKANVSIKGDNWATHLCWAGQPNSAMLIMTNEALWGISIENLSFSTQADHITGILGGSTLQKYNSAVGTFRNLKFTGLYCGISGNAEPGGVGIFDNLFENIFCSCCTYGLRLYGSGNTVIHPRITTCTYGLTLDFLNGESFDGIHVFGGIFASNICDICIPDARGTRPCNFVGTWFEDAKHGLLEVPNAHTRVMNLAFRDCMLNSKADGKEHFLFDARNLEGVITLDACTVIDDKGIRTPLSDHAVMSIRNLQTYHRDQTYVISGTAAGKAFCEYDGNVMAFPHQMRIAPAHITITPANSLAASARYYASVDEHNVYIHLLDPAVKGIYEFYWNAEA